MTTFEFKGDWNITKRRLKQKWAQLTAGDLHVMRVEGKREELLGWIQQRTGQTRDAIEQALKESCATCCA